MGSEMCIRDRNGVVAVFPLPAASVNVPPATFTVYKPTAVGVNVAVYTVDEVDVKLDNDPLVLTVISLTVKLVVASVEVNVRSMVESLDAVPLVTVVDVISMVGGILSYVQVNGVAAVFPLPARSVNVSPATFTVHKPSPDGVNVALYPSGTLLKISVLYSKF